MTSAGAPPTRLAPRSDWLRGGSAPSQGAGPRRLQSGEGHGGRRRAPPLRVQPAALGPTASATAAAYRLPPAAAHSPSPAPGAMEGMSALLARYPTAGLAGGLGVTACAAAGVLLYRIARR